MAHGPKSKKRRAFRTRRVNGLAQAAGYSGAREFKKVVLNRLMLDLPQTSAAENELFLLCIDAGY